MRHNVAAEQSGSEESKEVLSARKSERGRNQECQSNCARLPEGYAEKGNAKAIPYCRTKLAVASKPSVESKAPVQELRLLTRPTDETWTLSKSAVNSTKPVSGKSATSSS